ncbi:DUF4765 family protein [Escherichia coli]|uniref:DUF4765 family protein n=1 Tax=Escherichia coli TaxID=562 RepID=UPI0024DF3CAB|nr:DUF4765 family protein [Escherichia coli]
MKITNYILPTSRTHGSFSTIKSWDTMNYIKHLIRHTNDPIFEEQFYKITPVSYKLLSIPTNPYV